MNKNLILWFLAGSIFMVTISIQGRIEVLKQRVDALEMRIEDLEGRVGYMPFMAIISRFV